MRGNGHIWSVSPKTQTKPAAAQQACVRYARLDDSYAKCRCCLVETDVVPPTGEHKAPLDAWERKTDGDKTRHSRLHYDTASTLRLYSQVVYSHRSKYPFFQFYSDFMYSVNGAEQPSTECWQRRGVSSGFTWQHLQKETRTCLEDLTQTLQPLLPADLRYTVVLRSFLHLLHHHARPLWEIEA